MSSSKFDVNAKLEKVKETHVNFNQDKVKIRIKPKTKKKTKIGAWAFSN